MTALMYAVLYDYVDIVWVLLIWKTDIDFNLKNNEGNLVYDLIRPDSF